MNVADELKKEVAQKTEGQVELVFYEGGIMGDDADMVRKMRLKQLQGAGLTGMGLGKILPAERILELPLLFKDEAEVDRVLEALTPSFFAPQFENQGFKLMGWAENGFVYVFSKKPIRRFDDLNGVRIWVWAGDDYAMEVFKAIGVVTPVPIAVPEVLTALQTGLIDAFYNAPLAAVALQWQPHVSFMLDYPIVYGSAAFVLTKEAFDGIPQAYQGIIEEAFNKYARKIALVARQDNKRLLDAFPKRGIERVETSEDLKAGLKERFDPLYVRLAGRQYPKSLLEDTLKTLGKPMPKGL
jgi:TRAP-type C4-dicarboxylate transport system substrate-binding protein